ncbi:hypothetical protein RUND412_004585 [Rhizina undulata]
MTLRTDTSYLQEISYRKRVLEVIPYFQRIHAYICDHVDIYTTAAESLGVKYVAAEGYANMQCFLILAPSGETAHIFVWGQLGNVLDKYAHGLSWGKRISLNIGKLFIKDHPILIAMSGLQSLIFMSPAMLYQDLNNTTVVAHVSDPINPVAFVRRQRQDRIRCDFRGIRETGIDRIAAALWMKCPVAGKALYSKCVLVEALQRRTLKQRHFTKPYHPVDANEQDNAVGYPFLGTLEDASPFGSKSDVVLLLQRPPCWNLFHWQEKRVAEFKLTTIEEHNQFFDVALKCVFVGAKVGTRR